MLFNYGYSIDQYWYCDGKFMALKRKSADWVGESARDAAIDTSECLWAFDNGEVFLNGLKKCVVKVVKKPFLELHRYPERGYCGDYSRDQYIKLIVGIKIFIASTDDDIKKREALALLELIFKYVRRRLSIKFKQPLDLWLWTKAVKQNSKFLSAFFAMLTIPQILLYSMWNGFIFWSAGLKKVSMKDYSPGKKRTWWQKIVLKEWAHFPSYAFDKLYWQIFVLPNNLLKSILCAVASWTVERSNYVHRMLVGRKVTKVEVDSYEPMLFDRWSNWLMNINWGPLPMNGKYKGNFKDVAMLHKLYTLTQCPKKT